MSVLRRAASLLALLLAVVVGGQAVDVLPCSDESSPTEACSDGTASASFDADCVCHLTFVAGAACAPRLSGSLVWQAVPDDAPVALRDGVAPPLRRPPIG